jgi:hypothetical protein
MIFELPGGEARFWRIQRLANNVEVTVILIDLDVNPAYADISVKKLSQ